MTETKHTPGPWKVINESRIEAANYGLIASLRGEFSPHYETSANANARLIAAAPELLDALESLSGLEVKGHPLISRLQFSKEGRTLAAKITAAIAKAKGEA